MSVVQRIARWRVALGFVFGAMVFWLARPTWPSLIAGGSLAIAGEVLRIWAAGHIEKSREVTSSGPYRWIRHPLYLGTTIISLGIVIASRRWVVAGLVVLYVVVPLWSAIRAEEAHLRDKFGADYDAYAARQASPMARSFSATRALANREHHTIAGLLAGLTLLALKVGLSLR
jgi:protein-S-isoprenylcysteine O-methyltransferase Ste14